MRRYGNNMKCAFISVLMNLINGERPPHNFLPSTPLSKKATNFLVTTTPLFILRSPELSDSSITQWDAIKYYMEMVFHMNDLGIRKIFLLSKNVVTSTHFTANSWLHWYPWNTWLWGSQAGLLYSWHFQISSCDCNPGGAERHAWRPRSEVGLSPLKQEQCVATHLFRDVILLFVRIVDWMMWHFLLIPRTDG